MDTFDIINIIEKENILTMEILEIYLPSIDLKKRADLELFADIISKQKAKRLNEMLLDTNQFSTEIYNILISENIEIDPNREIESNDI